MEILYILLPVSILLVLGILGVLGWAVFGGQFEDLEQEGVRILKDADVENSSLSKSGRGD